MTYYYRVAVLPQDAERIHHLNYRTFVEEIPQHQANEKRLLVDAFHEENTYVLCLKDDDMVGMIAIREARPFSLDKKIGPIENHFTEPPVYPVEIRLLAIDQAHRKGRAFFGLMQALVNWCLKTGYDAVVISGTVRELKLYRQIGFVPFADPVGTEEAKYVPMIITHATFEKSTAKRIGLPMVNLLPGPVKIAKNVQSAFTGEPVSHRSPAYARLLASVEKKLLRLTEAQHVKVLQGTGTLANDAVAAQLSRISGKGLILVNGEFGRRLCEHAKRFGLSFDCFEQAWGKAFSMELLAERLDTGLYKWVWSVHSETSTGVLNELGQIAALCRERGIYSAADCASSIGTVSVDLKNVDFATSVSGKGLGGYSGLGLVFHKAAIDPDETIPCYLDLGLYEKCGGIPYTQSSNLLSALEQSLDNILQNPDQTFQQIQSCSDKLRTGMEKLGIEVLSPKDFSNPGILTLNLPATVSSQKLGDNLFLNGFCTHYESVYLQERNWLQLAAMNKPDDVEIKRFLEVLGYLI
ncbi:aminotransferase class V-fold PLP-dependent enzyme [Sporosarcina sp.]|uniref:aminotransferase class V-fold PLP-dependent enzyme n=1 Tax=Sporosarcina sp. TaxID=49982 RepID=UPI002613AC70|nr:aminotransferase class V-fold PLP-dependent enzyme [Sporosarcina sp.]